MRKLIALSFLISVVPLINSANGSDEIDQSYFMLAQISGLNCGLKPLPKLGYRIGRCINGQWEQVSEGYSSGLNCGLKPLPQLGYKIGRCINGQWEQVSEGYSSGLNCGLKPIPKLGYKIGRCINGQWEQVSR